MNPTSDTALAPELQQRLAQMWRRQLSAFSQESLIWLALVPGWTVELAEAVDFPTKPRTLSAFLDEAGAAGLCRRQETGFWMPKGVRQDVLAQLYQQVSVIRLLETAAEIGRRISTFKGSPSLIVPAPALRWSQLAARLSADGTAEAADWFNGHILSLVAGGQTGEALAWIETGTALANVFDELKTAVRLGNRRLELVYRRIQDERHVRNYLPRREQIDPFERLLDGRGGAWALHYVGMGGVGKTMLLRYITARLAPERKLATSRIDFDYISPDYPLRKPGQLLVELAAELRLYGSDESLLQQFDNSVKRLHEALSRQSSGDPLIDLTSHNGLFERMIRDFGRLLTRLPQPVILILDTCEELAKFQPVGARLPNVEATFAILERVQQMHDGVRVIFAGRRLLAQSGQGWEADTRHGIGKQHILPSHKPYLMLHEIRGFQETEAKAFLREIKRLQVAPDLYKTILQHSLETGSAIDLIGIVPDRRPRYNPFDLALFADWLREEPKLSVEQIRSGRQDPYIELRIRGRLNPELQQLLPAVALLGRFDEALFRLLVPGLDDEAFHALYRELGDQEWIDYQRDEALETTFLSVEPNLLPRLRDYYAGDGNRRRQLDALRGKLGPGLAELVRTRTLDQLSADHIDAALRFLPPAEGGALWAEIEQRIPFQANWNWAKRVTERILGREGAVSDDAHPLWAALQATLAAALIHQQPGHDARPIWQSVAQTAVNHPVELIGRWLQARAELGLLAADPIQRIEMDILNTIGTYCDLNARRPDLPATMPHPLTDRWVEWCLSEQLAAALCAALSRRLDAAEAAGDRALFRATASLVAWTDHLAEAGYADEIAVFAQMLAGRALILQGERGEGVQRLREAALMGAKIADPSSNRWADWVPPALLGAHLQLQQLLYDPPSPEQTGWGTVLHIIDTGGSPIFLAQIDGERLVARALELRLAHSLVPREALLPIGKALEYRVERQPDAWAHLQVPRLVVVLARALTGLGRANEALGLLKDHKDRATRSGRDERTVRETQLTMMAIARRMRLQRSRSLINESLQSQEADFVAEGWPAAVLVGLVEPEALPRPTAGTPLSIIHTWHRCQSDPEPFLTADEIMSGQDLHTLPFQALSVLLDLVEMNDDEAHRVLASFDPFAWQLAHRRQAEAALRLNLRWALLTDQVDDGLLETRLDERLQLPPRRQAEIALEEGELLALRRPDEAASLLVASRRWFTEAGDPVGVFMAEVLLAQWQGGPSRHVDLNSLQQHYEALSSDEQLPTWQSLMDLVDTLDEGTAFRFSHPDWDNWLERLLFCIVLAKNPAGAQALMGKLRRQLGHDNRGGPPVEFRLNSEQLESKGLTLDVENESHGWDNISLADLSGGITIDRTGTEPLHPEDVVPVRFTLDRRVVKQGELATVAGDGQTPGLRPYREAAAVLDTAILTSLRRLRQEMGNRLMDVPIRLPHPGLAHVPWEALLAYGLAGEDESPLAPLRSFRFWCTAAVSGGSLAAGPADLAGSGWRIGPIRVVSSRRWLRLVESGWESLSTALNSEPGLSSPRQSALLTTDVDRSSPQQLDRSLIQDILSTRFNVDELQTLCFDLGIDHENFSPAKLAMVRELILFMERRDRLSELLLYVQQIRPDTHIPYKLLHLIGTPLQASAGLHWQVTSEGEVEALYAQKSVPLEAAQRAGELLAADDLPVQVTPLVVLQAEPGILDANSTGTLLRDEYEREQAAYLRAYAGMVSMAGAAAVLTIPSLPPVLAEQVLSELAGAIKGKQPPGRDNLLTAVARIREIIVAAAGPDDDEQQPFEEIALDVCLFL